MKSFLAVCLLLVLKSPFSEATVLVQPRVSGPLIHPNTTTVRHTRHCLKAVFEKAARRPRCRLNLDDWKVLGWYSAMLPATGSAVWVLSQVYQILCSWALCGLATIVVLAAGVLVGSVLLFFLTLAVTDWRASRHCHCPPAGARRLE